IRRVLPLGARVREDARAKRYSDHQVLVLDHRRRAGNPLPGAYPRSAQAMEAQPDGPRKPSPLGALYAGEGSDVAALAYRRGAVVGRAGRRQEARAAELHSSSAEPGAVSRDRTSVHRVAGTRLP